MTTFEPVVEELNATVSRWEPVNNNDEASFQRVRMLLADLPDLLDAVASAAATLSGKSQDNVLFKAGAGDLFDETANYIRQAVEPLREVAAGIDEIHRDDLERIQETDPRVRAMDWGANQDVS